MAPMLHTVSADNMRALARQKVASSRQQQGLPPVVDDPVVLARVAAVLRGGVHATA